MIGGYDVTRLRADDAGALDDWLDENGYTLPDGAEPILADYVDEDWRFVAIRLAAGAAGALKPLRVAFDTDAPVYPMQLAQFVLDPGRPHALRARRRRTQRSTASPRPGRGPSRR